MPAIPLPARCDRAVAQELLPHLLDQADQGALKIDASGVQQIGQAMLQLLVSARRSGSGAQITPSPALLEAARLTGLHTILFDTPSDKSAA
ncbi:MAG: STAS domain-containing protein [Sphingomonadales bacterium]|nr:STAS domain-containing protein [Sphingomonadales bacterium]MDE2168896.1 STAS domain-containing protein [Sphingomonadales bacterium]